MRSMTGLGRRIAMAACPRRDRPWLEALFAEAAAIDSARARVAWLSGATRLVAHSSFHRAAVTGRTALGLALVLAVAALSVALAYLEFEALHADDDVFVVSAALASVAFIALAGRTWQAGTAEADAPREDVI